MAYKKRCSVVELLDLTKSGDVEKEAKKKQLFQKQQVCLTDVKGDLEKLEMLINEIQVWYLHVLVGSDRETRNDCKKEAVKVFILRLAVVIAILSTVTCFDKTKHVVSILKIFMHMLI